MNPKKILLMGLPGAGKTYLAEKLVPLVDAMHLNADTIRSQYNDWDFSDAGRERQAKRMRDLADAEIQKGKHVIVDFVCPTPKTRRLFDPDMIVWVDTIQEGRFEDTNQVFEKPEAYDFRITKKSEGDFWPVYIAKRILNTQWDSKAPTVQLLGRWQPWHEGHRALFEKAIAKTGQVCLMVRDCHGIGDNPFCSEDVAERIVENLSDMYEKGTDYIIHHVPNITHITYGRSVGYTIAQEHLGAEIENISATKKRKELREKGEL